MRQSSNYFAVLSLDNGEEAADEEQQQDFEASTIPSTNPNTPSVDASPIVEKVPAEIRLKIFERVLQAQHSVVNVSHLEQYQGGRIFNTALFAVTRTIAAEAEETFYNINTIRVKSLNDPYLKRTLTRNLELVGDVPKRMFLWPGGRDTSPLSKAVAHLPKLTTLSLATDSLFDGPLPSHSARQFSSSLSSTAVQKEATYPPGFIDFGIEEVTTLEPRPYKFFLKRFRLIDAVRHTRALSPSLSLTDLKSRYDLVDPTTREGVNSRFALWIKCLKSLHATQEGNELDEEGEEILDGCFFLPPPLQAIAERLFEKTPKKVRVMDLTVAEHGMRVMQLAEDAIGSVSLVPPKKR